MSKQFTLYTHNGGPNGWKVAIVLKELGLEYESIYLDFNSGAHKQPSHTKYNPNGRIPTLIDHSNNDLAIWESNAILLYLVGKYDKDQKISIDMTKLDQMASLNTWLFFQASGQGPYYGQAAWFSMFHSEKVPSAIERYQNEILRVTQVLEDVLSKQQWLVADKCTIADLSFIPWQSFAGRILGDKLDMAKFPSVQKWTEALHARPAVAKSLKEWDEKKASK